MIDAALDWYCGRVARSQMLEADRLDRQADSIRRRAAHLREMAGVYFKLKEIEKLSNTPAIRGGE